MDVDELRRFEARYHVEPNTGCWLWIGNLDASGYGRTYFRHRDYLAHRVVYEIHNGPIQPGLELDHLCRQRCCVNPDHLEPVTHQENMRRGVAGAAASARAKLITACKRGHDLAGENLRVYDGRRCCVICRREAGRRWHVRQRSKRAQREANR